MPMAKYHFSNGQIESAWLSFSTGTATAMSEIIEWILFDLSYSVPLSAIFRQNHPWNEWIWHRLRNLIGVSTVKTLEISQTPACCFFPYFWRGTSSENLIFQATECVNVRSVGSKYSKFSLLLRVNG